MWYGKCELSQGSNLRQATTLTDTGLISEDVEFVEENGQLQMIEVGVTELVDESPARRCVVITTRD